MRLSRDPCFPSWRGPRALPCWAVARVSIVRLLDVPDELISAVVRLRTEVPRSQHPGWLPHVTLARRVPRSSIPTALDVLGHDDLTLRLSELRRWDPDAGTVRAL